MRPRDDEDVDGKRRRFGARTDKMKQQLVILWVGVFFAGLILSAALPATRHDGLAASPVACRGPFTGIEDPLVTSYSPGRKLFVPLPSRAADPPPKDLMAFIFFRSDLGQLRAALDSARELWPVMHVIDNSEGAILRHENLGDVVAELIIPPVPLTFAQSQNLAQTRCDADEHCRYIAYMHTDTILTPPAVDTVLREARRMDEEHGANGWSMVLCNYDAFVLFNREATRPFGPWDATYAQYNSDIDYYHRLRSLRKGQVASHLCKHEVSSTIRRNPCAAYINKVTYAGTRAYLEAKWGTKLVAKDILEESGQDFKGYRVEFQADYMKDIFRFRMLAALLVLGAIVTLVILRKDEIRAACARPPLLILAGLLVVLTYIIDRAIEPAYFIGVLN